MRVLNPLVNLREACQSIHPSIKLLIDLSNDPSIRQTINQQTHHRYSVTECIVISQQTLS